MQLVPIKQLDHVDQFLRSFSSENTRIAYERDLQDYVEFCQGADPTSFSTLAQYREHLISSFASATVVRKFSAVKSFFAFLASEGLIPSNPAQNLRMPRSVTVDPTEAFDDAEVVRVIEQADSCSFAGSTHKLMLVLLFNLGLRRSELVNIRLSSLGEHRGRRFISIIGKGDKSRVIPLTDLVLREISEYLARYRTFTGQELGQQDFLIQSSPREKNAKPMNPSTVYRLVRQYAEAAGVTKRVSPHSCRATTISHLLEKGVSPRSVADMAGHTSIHTTVDIYDRKRDALTSRTAFMVDYGSSPGN